MDYNRDVRPILADHCFPCHGPDAGKRKADLRFDIDLAKQKRNHAIIAAGDPAASELIRRVTAADVSDRMPPAKFARPLSAQADRNAASVGQAGGQVGETLDPDSTRAAGFAGRSQSKVHNPQSHRPVCLFPAGEGRASRPRPKPIAPR